MIIVAGDLKGRRLKTPRDKSVRPTAGKTKEAVFSMIQQYIEDSVCIDLFCGSGNLGIEAISRGAAKCYFSDVSRDSIRLTEENIEMCGIEDKSVILFGDYKRNLAAVNEKADIIFLDPPYGTGLIEKACEIIRDREMLSEDGLIIAEYGSSEELPDMLYGFEKIKEKKYGISIISIFR